MESFGYGSSNDVLCAVISPAYYLADLSLHLGCVLQSTSERKKDRLIPEIFICSALALPVGSFNFDIEAPPFEKQIFINEYKRLIDFLKHRYPNDEFLILPIRKIKEDNRRPPGWTPIPYFWRNHRLYRKPKPDWYA